MMVDRIFAVALMLAVVLGGAVEFAAPAPAPANSPSWRSVTLGATHACGVRSNGSLWCWGGNENGQLGDGTFSDRQSPAIVGTASDWASVDGGGGHTCGTTAPGALWCWGENGWGQLGTGGSDPSRPLPVRIGAATTWDSVSAGSAHTCGVGNNGTLWCWGYNEDGQLGDGSTSARRAPTQVGAGASWDTVAAGQDHTCGVQTGGTLWCWGANYRGQLGDGTTAERRTPTQVGIAAHWASVDVDDSHTCGIQTNGTLWCWGANGDLGVGDGTRERRLLPTQIGAASEWVTVDVDSHTCGIQTDQTLWCWGYNSHGEVGDGTDRIRLAPVAVGTAADWAAVAVGWAHSCGIRTSGTLWCWGRPMDGHPPAFGSGDYRVDPTRVPTSTGWASVSAGLSRTCGRGTNGTLWCWGRTAGPTVNDDDWIGAPVAVGDANDWRIVDSGHEHACGIRANGALWCVGANDQGQLGDGTKDATPAPKQVGRAQLDQCQRYQCLHLRHTQQRHAVVLGETTGADNWETVRGSDARPRRGSTEPVTGSASVQGSATRAVFAETARSVLGPRGTLLGQLGDGTSARRLKPRRIGRARNWSTISAGADHSCGTVRNGGTLWCWGDNWSGQLGIGSKRVRTTPTQVGRLTGWATVPPGGEHSCGTRRNGTLWCWGSDDYGQLGNGERAGDRTVPTAVGTSNNWTILGLGYSHTCGTRHNGELWCWGRNDDGQLGLDLLTPTEVVS